MKIRFWGTRGSIPSPGPATVKYGGNTPCVEVTCGETMLILDAGTGLRMLGLDLMARANGHCRLHILISHFHWDHIQGFPFFAPAYVPKFHITIYGAEGIGHNLEGVFAGQMTDDYFPVTLKDMAARRDFRSLSEEEFAIDGVNVATHYVNHPGVALCYRLEHQGRKLCYISDNEPQAYLARQSQGNNGAGKELLRDMADGKLAFGPADQGLAEFVRGVDVLVHDSQYTPSEYCQKMGWGHSLFHFPVELALRAGARKLVLFHHDPTHSDAQVDQILQAAKAIIQSRGSGLECEAAQEGAEIEI